MLSGIDTTATVADARAVPRGLFEAIYKQLGVVPNFFRVVSNSSAALGDYLRLMGALGKGELSAQTFERMAPAVAAISGCDDRVLAHRYFGKNIAKLHVAEITPNRNRGSADPKAAGGALFSKQEADIHGRLSDPDPKAVEVSGYSDAAVVEIVPDLAFRLWMNYVNTVTGTEINFPVVHV